MCLEVRFHAIDLALSRGPAACQLHSQHLLLVDLHPEVRNQHPGLCGSLLGLLERFLQRAIGLLLLRALPTNCLLRGSLVLLLERMELRGVWILERLNLTGQNPLCGPW